LRKQKKLDAIVAGDFFVLEDGDCPDGTDGHVEDDVDEAAYDVTEWDWPVDGDSVCEPEELPVGQDGVTEFADRVEERRSGVALEQIAGDQAEEEDHGTDRQIGDDVETGGETHGEGGHCDDGEVEQDQGAAEVGEGKRRSFPGCHADDCVDRDEEGGGVGRHFGEGAAAPEVEQHADDADGDQDSEVEQEDAPVESELIGGDIDRDDRRDVAEQREEGDGSADSGDFPEDERPAEDRFRQQQEHGAVAHFPRNGVRGAEHGDDEAENEAGGHRTVDHQFELLGKNKKRRRRVDPDQDERCEEHQEIDRFADRLFEGVDADLEIIEHAWTLFSGFLFRGGGSGGRIGELDVFHRNIIGCGRGLLHRLEFLVGARRRAKEFALAQNVVAESFVVSAEVAEAEQKGGLVRDAVPVFALDADGRNGLVEQIEVFRRDVAVIAEDDDTAQFQELDELRQIFFGNLVGVAFGLHVDDPLIFAFRGRQQEIGLTAFIENQLSHESWALIVAGDDQRDDIPFRSVREPGCCGEDAGGGDKRQKNEAGLECSRYAHLQNLPCVSMSAG